MNAVIGSLLMLLNLNISYTELKVLYIPPHYDKVSVTADQVSAMLKNNEWSNIQYELFFQDYDKERTLGKRNPSVDSSIHRKYDFSLSQCVIVIKSLDLKTYESDISGFKDAVIYSKEIAETDSIAAYGEFINNQEIIGSFILYRDKDEIKYKEYAQICDHYVESGIVIDFLNHIFADKNIKDRYVFIDEYSPMK